MGYPNGVPNANSAARLPWLVKGGIVAPTDRYMIDDSKPNNWLEFEDNAAGTGKIHYLIGVDTNNQTYLRNPNGVLAFDLQLVQLATPAAPTITNVGTAGAVTWTYVVVARNGVGATLGTSPASAAGSTTTGNATLTSANYNVIAWASVSGAAFYDVYRTVAGTTPSTTGLIGTVASTTVVTTGLQPATYSLNDTALAGDGTTAPTVNTSGLIATGNFSTPLLTPVNVVATPQGTTGATTISYKIVAVNSAGGVTAASSAGTTTTANATLTSVNSVKVTWNSVVGAASYKIYRTAAGGTPSTTGLIGTLAATSGTQTFTDTGLAGDSSTAPTVNTTGASTTTGPTTSYTASNYIGSETGANNALVAALLDSSGAAVPLAAGLLIYLKIGHTTQAGANSLNLNAAGVKSIKKSSNPANDLAVVHAVGSIMQLVYDGTVFQSLME